MDGEKFGGNVLCERRIYFLKSYLLKNKINKFNWWVDRDYVIFVIKFGFFSLVFGDYMENKSFYF